MFEGLFQPMHLILVLAIALLVFGPSKLPELGSSFGKAIKNFKKSMEELNTKPAEDQPILKDADQDLKKIINKDV
jgi:sec-independent protein translocase protein TatA